MKRRWMGGWAEVLAAGLLMEFVPGAVAARRGVDCRIEMDRRLLHAGSPQRVILKITLEAPEPPPAKERPPVNLALVLDRSGSMSGTKLEKAKEAAVQALRRLGRRDWFSLVIYDHNVETLVPAQSADNVEWIEGRIRGIEAGGNTALFGGVSQGAAEVRKHLGGNSVPRILLLSDGLANVGPSTPEDLGRLGTALRKEGISVTTIGVGTDYNEDLMTRLAQNSDGNTYFVESSDDLPRIFAAELGDVLSVVARRVILEIECAGGARPIRLIGRDGRIREGSVEIGLNQLYGGQEKYVLLEVEVPSAATDEERPVARARCRYEDAVSREPRETAGEVSARFTASEEDVRRSANAAVQQEIARNEVALAKDRAVELWDAGRKADAVAELKQAGTAVRARGASFGFAGAAARVAEDAEAAAEALEREGMGKSTRKEFRAESYQIRYQQENQ